jgi:hypothetical protein
MGLFCLDLWPSARRSRYSGATAQDRNEVGAVLVAAGLGPPPEHALLYLLALKRAAGIGDYWCRHRASGSGARAARIIDRQ